MKFLIYLMLCIVATAALARAELIPADRRVDWTPGTMVGVPQGIPTDRTHLVDVTKTPYNADNTGRSDSSGAIQAALDAANPGDVIFLPAGTYLCAQAIFTKYKSGITLRGSGESTVINSTVTTGIFLQVGGGSDYNWSWPTSGNIITAGLGKGSTQITIADTSVFSPGQLVQISLDNDPALPVVSVYGYQGVRRQMSRVTAKTATTLSIFPGLYGDYSATRALIHVAQFQANSVGIENLLIDLSKSTDIYSIWLEQAYGCWVENVHVRYSSNYQLFLNDSLNCEVRHCYLDQLNHTGSNGAGILCNTISGCLVEDNIIYKAFPLIEVNHGSSGNVFAYNFCEDSGPGAGIDSNHGPHNEFNLYEGNIAPNLQSDGYYGSASYDVVFRNWFHATLNGQMAWGLSLNRFTRYYSVVGNVIEKDGLPWPADGVGLGNPNMGNGNSSGTAPPWTDGLIPGTGTLSQTDQTITASTNTFTSSNVGWFLLLSPNNILTMITGYTNARTVTVNSSQSLAGVSYILSPGTSGYQELDTGVAATLIRKSNFYYYNRGIPAVEALSGEVLPNSMFRTVKPAWFGNLAWPPFDPANPATSNLSIPAGFRYVNGTDPFTAAPTTQQKPLNVKVSR